MPAPTVHEKREINRGNLAVSIPFDLLSDIFIRLMESEMTPTSNYIPPTALLAVRKMRHTFCQVCHVWREAAIATKRIWAVVGFPHAAQELKTKAKVKSKTKNPTPNHYDPLEISSRSFELLRKDIDLTSETPFYLYIYSRDSTGRPLKASSSIIEATSRAIQNSLHRCRHIQLDSGCIQISKVFTASPLPELSSMHASVHPTELCPADSLNLTSAPQLQDLWLRAAQSGPGTARSALKITHGTNLLLTKLDIGGYIEYSSVIGILKNSPCLEELCWNDYKTREIDPKPISMPHMSSLRHVTLWGELPLSILCSLTAPNLALLEFHYPEQGFTPKNWASRPFPLATPAQFPLMQVLVLKGDTTIAQSQEATIFRFIELHHHLEVVALPMHLSKRMATALTSISALQHVRAMRRVGDNGGALSLVRAWGGGQDSVSDIAGDSSSAYSLPTLYLVPDLTTLTVDTTESDDDTDLLNKHIVLDDWKFRSWSPADWDQFLAAKTDVYA